VCLGIPGKVMSIEEANGLRMGQVDFGGVIKEACLAYVPGVSVGDFVIVHVGFAISRVDEEAARSTYAALQDLDLLSGELG
jgi:hydrogenase expression/formation protein HypC